MGIEDRTIIKKFIKAEQEHPSARKEVEEYTIYASRAFWTYLKICTCSTVRTQKRGDT